MSKLLLSLFCLCLFFSAGYSQTKAKWKELVSKEEGFRIEFPISPQRSTKDLKMPEGTLRYTDYEAGLGIISFTLSYADYPSVPEMDEQALRAHYDTLQEGILQRPGAVLISSRDVWLKENMGREVRIKVGSAGIVHYRTFMVGKRMYQTVTATRVSLRDDAATRQTVDRFLDSFQIIDVGK